MADRTVLHTPVLPQVRGLLYGIIRIKCCKAAPTMCNVDGFSQFDFSSLHMPEDVNECSSSPCHHAVVC